MGYRLLQAQRKKQVAGMLNIASGIMPESESGLLVDPTQEDPFETFLRKGAFPRHVKELIQQAGLQWSIRRLFAAMAIGAALGAVIGVTFQPSGFTTVSAVAFAMLAEPIPYFYLTLK